jgi:hypothetical protein
MPFRRNQLDVFEVRSPELLGNELCRPKDIEPVFGRRAYARNA